MRGFWLRQDPALRAFPRWLVWSLASTPLLLGLAVNLHLQYRRAGGELDSVVSAVGYGLVLWLPAMVFMLSRGSRRRCSSFDLSLPLSTGHLWLRHLLATALSGVLLLTTVGGIAAVMMLVVNRFMETLPVEPAGMPRLTATLAVSFILMATLVQMAAPGRASLPGSRAFTVRALLLGVALFAFAVILMQLPPGLLLVPGILALFLARSTLRRLPAVWSAESEWSEPGASEAAAQPTGGQPTAGQPTAGQPTTAVQGGSWTELPQAPLPWGGLRWQWFLLRAIHSGTPKASMTLWIGVPLVLGFGALLAGALSYVGDEELRWALLFISIYMLFALSAKPLTYLHPLDALPLSRRHLFALLTLPSLLLLFAGYAAGVVILEWRGLPTTTGIRTLSTCAGVGVPTEYHSISWDGEVEPIVSPSGESHAPYTAPLFAGLKPLVVSRFCTRDSNVSLEYQVFQAGLAAETMYGEVPPDDSIRLWFADSSDSLRADTPRPLDFGATPQTPGRAPLFPVLMAVVFVGSFGTLAFYLRTFRVGRLDRVRKFAFAGTLTILLVLHTAQFIFVAARLTSLWVWDAFWRIGTRSLAAALPGGAPMLWILAALVIMIAYRLAERQFERAELPVSKGRRPAEA
jgi:hypothetical protein